MNSRYRKGNNSTNASPCWKKEAHCFDSHENGGGGKKQGESPSAEPYSTQRKRREDKRREHTHPEISCAGRGAGVRSA